MPGSKGVSAGIRAKYQVKHKNHQAPQTLAWRQIFQTILIVPLYSHPFSHLLPRPLSAFFTPALKSQSLLNPPSASRSPLLNSVILPLQPLKQPQTPSTPRAPSPEVPCNPSLRF